MYVWIQSDGPYRMMLGCRWLPDIAPVRNARRTLVISQPYTSGLMQSGNSLRLLLSSLEHVRRLESYLLG